MTLLQAMLELNRLDAAINEKRATLAESNLVSETVVNEEKDFSVDITAEVADVRKVWEDLILLLNQRARLQESITVANSRVGLDVLLSKRNMLRNTIKILSALTMRGYGNRVKARTTHSPWTADKTAYWKHEVMQYAVPTDEINEQVTLLKNELQELEVKIATLNNQPLD